MCLNPQILKITVNYALEVQTAADFQLPMNSVRKRRVQRVYLNEAVNARLYSSWLVAEN